MSAALPILKRVLLNRKMSWSIWAAALAGTCVLYTGLYPSMEKADVEGMLKALPPAMVEALGYEDMATAVGYVGSAIYGLVAFALLLVFAVGAGGRLLAGDEEDGVLELELSSPLSRSDVYVQRLAALWTQLTSLVLVVSITVLLTDLIASLAIPFVQLATVSLMLWLIIGLFGSLAFVVGAATGRRSLALGVAGGVALVSWMFNAIGPTIDQDWMQTVSPVGWYMADNPMTRGFHLVDTLLLATCIALVTAAGWYRFLRRDLMT